MALGGGGVRMVLSSKRGQILLSGTGWSSSLDTELWKQDTVVAAVRSYWDVLAFLGFTAGSHCHGNLRTSRILGLTADTAAPDSPQEHAFFWGKVIKSDLGCILLVSLRPQGDGPHC